jgi:hypothetical protein
MIGRPPTTSDTFCSTPLPLPHTEEELRDERILRLVSDQEARKAFVNSILFTEPAFTTDDHIYSRQPESKRMQFQQITQNPTPSISLYFLYAVDLAYLTRKAVDTLYAPRATRRPWREIQIHIFTLNSNADKWQSRLPAEFRFVDLNVSQTFARERASLAFRFYTTKLIITYQCLRRLAYLSDVGSPGAVCENIAAMCVQVAGQILDLLPDEVDTTWLYKVSPWWCILHHIMQSSTVLLIALSTQLQPAIAEVINIVEKVKKAIRWLNGMSARDPCSRRALPIYMDLLSRHESKIGSKLGIGRQI